MLHNFFQHTTVGFRARSAPTPASSGSRSGHLAVRAHDSAGPGIPHALSLYRNTSLAAYSPPPSFLALPVYTPPSRAVLHLCTLRLDVIRQLRAICHSRVMSHDARTFVIVLLGVGFRAAGVQALLGKEACARAPTHASRRVSAPARTYREREEEWERETERRIGFRAVYPQMLTLPKVIQFIYDNK